MMGRMGVFERIAIALVVLWVIAFAVTPNLMVFLTSILSPEAEDLVRMRFSLESYSRFLDPLFIAMVGQSLRLAFCATLICLLLGYPFAYFLSGTPRANRNQLLLLLIIPFWTSSLIRTYALIIILKANGLINSILMGLGIIDHPLKLLYTDGAVLLGLVYTLLPFMILPIYSVLEKLDNRYKEAARDLGASRMSVFWLITVPLSLPGVMAGMMLTFLPALGMFYIPDILGGAKVMLVGNFIRNQFLTAGDWPLGAAASIALNIVMAVMLFVYYKASKRVSQDALL
ncbi:MAG: spermidine/putrescine ABC transporter permease PotB [Desulfovibrio sp.]|uniref:spermidine/putrescine ABC transporter permease PotB n=1 Tax=Desulfovibrio sp. 7SRBS1 TaxID=3378064 RepID=UPI003B400C8C